MIIIAAAAAAEHDEPQSRPVPSPRGAADSQSVSEWDLKYPVAAASQHVTSRHDDATTAGSIKNPSSDTK